MPSLVEWVARDLCRESGYDPDRIIVEVDVDRDFDYLAIGVAPVDIKRLKPMFVKFLHAAQQKIEEAELTEKRLSLVAEPA